MQVGQIGVDQAYPSTFAALEQIVFNTCEGFVNAARHAAALESVSLTITHKSRNSPGKEPSQYRGCVVLNCQQWEQGCSFEIKGYGPIEGGWRMRPLQHPGLKKHTVTSWCICNHPKVALRVVDIPQISTWAELVTCSFEKPDDFIAAATQVAALNSVDIYLLTLMISDGKPKSNGRNGEYVPRGFFTLECVQSENGCPFAIKSREEDEGWVMRPWREKGKNDIKGAVSTIICKHSPEHVANYLSKKSDKPKTKKSKKMKALEREQREQNGELVHDTSESPIVSGDIPSGLESGLDPALQHITFDPDPAALSPSQILSTIEEQLSADTSFAFVDSSYERFTSPSHLGHDLDIVGLQTGTSGGSNDFGTGTSSLEQFRNALAGYPIHHQPAPSTSTSNLHTNLSSNNNKRSAEDEISVNGSNSTSPRQIKKAKTKPANTVSSLKASWKSFLAVLDPEGRLSTLLPALSTGGIDPGAVVIWPAEEVGHFVDMVGGEVLPGVKVHFRHLLKTEGKRAWEELNTAGTSKVWDDVQVQG